MSEQEADRPDNLIDSQQETAAIQPSPGQQLAAYREAHGWSVEQVASQLNMAPRQIRAIESDDYDALPGMAIVRGFIRSYAKLLRVDATPLLARVGTSTATAPQSIAAPSDLSAPFSEARVPTLVDRPGAPVKKIIALLLVLVLSVAVYVALQGGSMEGLTDRIQVDLSGSADSTATETTTASAPVTDQSAAEESAEVQRASNSDAPPVPEPPASPSEAAAVPAASETAAAPAAPSTQNDAAAAKEVVAPPGPNSLVLKIREDSWIEIKRADDSVILSRLVKAGETEAVEVKGTLSVVIGNASGVDASLRGKPLELKTNRNSNVAVLSLK